MKYGGANASTGEVMILVSVGSEFLPGVKVQSGVRGYSNQSVYGVCVCVCVCPGMREFSP